MADRKELFCSYFNINTAWQQLNDEELRDQLRAVFACSHDENNHIISSLIRLIFASMMIISLHSTSAQPEEL